MTNEELAAIATIAAAKIQADITLKAAYYNCAAIIIGLFITWMTALHILGYITLNTLKSQQVIS
ncbi:hypothetical protein DMB35_11350, partial [Acinetobacter baumannii A424]